jgi:very-short-patch-repair endonuclease
VPGSADDTLANVDLATRSELLKRLGSRAAFEDAVRGREWVRVLRGAYVREGDADDLAVRARAAQLLLPQEAWAADRFLLWLLGVDVLPPGPVVVEAVVPRLAVVPRRAGIRVRECAVPARDRSCLGELRILKPMRAVADLLRLLPDVERTVVADAAVRDGASIDDLRAELTLHRGLRGVRDAHRALDRADGRAESPPESRLRHILMDVGLDLVPQFEVIAPDGRWLARVDLALPDLRIAIEYDGREVHDRPDAFVNDRRRQNGLVAAGWIVLRFTAADLKSPGRVIAIVRQAMVRAA